MGELLAGRSATWPTFSRSTSVRTRMDLQYSQTVCTLADQRNVIFAPQLGQFAVGCVTGHDLQSPAPGRPLDCRIFLPREPERRWPRTCPPDVIQSPR